MVLAIEPFGAICVKHRSLLVEASSRDTVTLLADFVEVAASVADFLVGRAGREGEGLFGNRFRGVEGVGAEG